MSDQDLLDYKSGVPLYLQLAGIIRDWVLSGALPPDSVAPSETQLVERYGLSRFTVRHAYQQLVSDGLMVRVRGRGTFVTSRPVPASGGEPASQSSTEGLRSIAFIVRDIAEGIQPILVQRVSSVAFDLGYSTTVCNTGLSLDRALRHIDNVAGQGVSGAVFMPLPSEPHDEVNSRICGHLHTHGLPYVLVDVPLPEVHATCVSSDNREGGRLIGRYLRSKRHHNVLVVTNCENQSIIERIAGLTEVLETSPKQIRAYDQIDQDFERKLEMELRATDRPTALFAVHDGIARRVFTFLRQHGIEVPGDVSLIGYDDLDFCELLPVPLTTVHQPLDEVGARAVDLLTGLIDKPDQDPRHVQVPVHLVERASVRDLNGRASPATSPGGGKEAYGE